MVDDMDKVVIIMKEIQTAKKVVFENWQAVHGQRKWLESNGLPTDVIKGEVDDLNEKLSHLKALQLQEKYLNYQMQDNYFALKNNVRKAAR